MVLPDWNLAYDFAAAVGMIMLFVWYGNEKRIPSRAHRAFLGTCIGIFMMVVAEIIEVFFVRYREHISDGAMSIVLYAQIMAILSACLYFAYYIRLTTKVSQKNIENFTLIIKVSSITCFTLVLLNPLVKWLFYFDNHVLKPGKLFVLPYLIGILVMLSAFGNITKLSREITLRKCVILIVNFFICIAALILQITGVATIFSFALVIGCMTVYHYLQNPHSVMDTTTGQFNRRFMNEYIKYRFDVNKSMGVFLIAMDDFKFINKSYGIDVGDQLLCQVGEYLNGLKYPGEIFRYGSDQFCAVMDKNLSQISEIAAEIHERFMHPWYTESAEAIMMSASICIVRCPQEAADVGELVEILDYSMALAKKTKKGGISYASDMNLDKVRRDKAVEKAIKLAMDREDIMVYYQPIYSVEKGSYNSAEALVRLKDDELGWIPPDEFIPLAEKNGLIVDMGDMILEKVCRFIHDFNLKESSIEYIEVNISTVQLIHKDFADRVKRILEKYEVSPDQINIEITETATMGDVSVVNDNIRELVEYGISFSLDDYGSGYSNIDYINQMPFTIIKLDKSIIWDAFKNDKAGITLKYTIGMLNALKLLIVAEGVETEEMKNHLVEIGCHYMQGWYYSKAVSDHEFMTLIEKTA
ncbi:MAG: bifunctional diguanylate cyclase/phosphodiesterase [Lachnospiraceae bacterium]|nr:bifunctional diguanylate cyclase/phosphodiesterase [Lachnospiraceae bacterium]